MSNLMKSICITATLCLLTQSTGWARKVEHWPYARLFEDADVVVIARAVATDKCADKWNEQFFDGVRFQGLETKLEVVGILKGKPPESLKLLHFQYKPEATSYDDGPGLVSFLNKPRQTAVDKHVDRSGELRPLSASRSSHPEYLLFLRLRKDGRFEAVSGQLDPNVSVRSISQVG